MVGGAPFWSRFLLFCGLVTPKPSAYGGNLVIGSTLRGPLPVGCVSWSLNRCHATVEGHENRIRHSWTRRGAWGGTRRVQQSRNRAGAPTKPNSTYQPEQTPTSLLRCRFRATDLSCEADSSSLDRDQATSHFSDRQKEERSSRRSRALPDGGPKGRRERRPPKGGRSVRETRV